MALHFDREELDGRRRRVLEAMAARGLDALLIFKQRLGSAERSTLLPLSLFS